MTRRARSLPLLALLGVLAACAPGTTPAPPAKPAAPPPAATAAAANASAAGPTSGSPTLATSPAVELKVGTLPLAMFGPFFIAAARGYFNEVGLNVEFSSASTTTEHLPALAQGQLHVSSGASNLSQYNAMGRHLDLQIVADLQSAGKTEKSTGNSGLVVRKDLWDSGTIRDARDLVGRKVGIIGIPGSGHHIQAIRWLRRAGVDPQSVDWTRLSFPDQLAALQNRTIEASIQTEPLLTAGLNRGIHQLMATQEEMYPHTQVLYVLYWSGIQRLGPLVGERFMVAYLRGVRDYINAFEYGVDQDAIIDILIQETTLKDPTVYRQIKYAWMDPNGILSRAQMESDIELLRELGELTTAPDLGAMIQDKYRQYAVQHLGEYHPPR